MHFQRCRARGVNYLRPDGWPGGRKSPHDLVAHPGFLLFMITFQNKIHYSRDLEVGVVGVCLIEPAAIFKIKSILTPAMFYYSEGQQVYQGLIEMADQAIPIDLITAVDYFTRVKQFTHIEKHQTAYILSRLTNEVVSSAHLITWAKIMKAMWTSRELARVNPGSVKELQDTARRLSTTSSSKTKIYRFLLNYVDKRVIRQSWNKFGAKIITGRSSYKIGVSSPLLVYLMSIIEPEFTWTCTGWSAIELTNDQCKERIPKDALYTLSGWIDKTHKFPVTWR